MKRCLLSEAISTMWRAPRWRAKLRWPRAETLSKNNIAMPEIKNRTMLIAIQAVATHIRAMREELAAGDAEPEDYVLLEQAIEAAEDLERAYEVEAKTVLNLPSYDQLVAG